MERPDSGAVKACSAPTMRLAPPSVAASWRFLIVWSRFRRRPCWLLVPAPDDDGAVRAEGNLAAPWQQPKGLPCLLRLAAPITDRRGGCICHTRPLLACIPSRTRR